MPQTTTNAQIDTNYFQVVTNEKGDTAEMLMYGVIGQSEWWTSSTENDITDIAFAKQLKELEQKYSRINIRINSPGGSVFHGNAIITAIQNSPAEIHLYNDGLCASMAFVIWAAGKKGHRHMAKNASGMAHSPSDLTFGNAEVHRAAAEMLDKLEETGMAVLMDALDQTKEEVKANFFDYKDHWLSYDDIVEMGLVEADDLENYEAEDLVVTASEKTTMMNLLSKFAKKGDKAAQSFIDHLQAKTNQLQAVIQQAASFHKPNNSVKMNFEEFKQAYKEGKLPAEDVQAFLAEQTPAPEPPPVAPTATVEPDKPSLADQVAAAVATAMKPLQDEINALKSAPGGTPSGVASNGDINSDPAPKTALQTFNEECESIARSGGQAHFK